MKGKPLVLQALMMMMKKVQLRGHWEHHPHHSQQQLVLTLAQIQMVQAWLVQ